MAKKAPREAPKETKGRRTTTPPRPKPRVMKAALLMWAHRIYHSADEAVMAAGGYASEAENPPRFKVYADIFEDLQELAAKFDAMAGKPPMKYPSVRGGCEDDQDCPDDQICVHGTCRPLFPQD